MELTDQAFHLIKNTPKVTGFLGSDNKPIPITDAEAARILNQVAEGVERPKTSISFEIGEQVRVADGPFRFLLRPGRGSRRRAVAAQGGRVHFRQAAACQKMDTATLSRDHSRRLPLPGRRRKRRGSRQRAPARRFESDRGLWPFDALGHLLGCGSASASVIGIGLVVVPRKPVTFGCVFDQVEGLVGQLHLY